MINANYQKLLFAYFLSSLGDWLYKLAMPVFLYQKTGSPMVMAITYGLTFLPFVLVTPFGGVIADRLSRKQMLVRGDYLSFGLTLLLTLLLFFHTAQLWLLYLLVFCISAVNSLYHPIFQSILPDIVEKDNLTKANAFISSAENLILFLGPVASGVVIAFLGPKLAIFINAISFLISALLLSTLCVKSALSHAKSISIATIFQDLKEGFIFSYQLPIIKFGCLLFIFANFGVQIILANLMFYLTNNLHLTPLWIGITFSLMGMGGILGSLAAPLFSKMMTPGRLILCGCLGEGITVLFMLWIKGWQGVSIACGLCSFCMSIVIITYFTLRQKIVPGHYLGRVIAITRLISYCAIPIASLVGGWLLKNHYEFKDIVWIGSMVMIINGLIGWLTPLNQKTMSTPLKIMEET